MEATDRRKLTVVKREGMSAVLDDLGFSNVKSSLRFRRPTKSSLVHFIWLAASYGRYQLQWAVVSDEAGPVIFDRYRPDNPDYHVMYGEGRDIGATSFGQFDPEATPDESLGAVALRLAADTKITAQHLDQFATERELWQHLMYFYNHEQESPDYFFPRFGPLTVFTAAALAVVAGDPEARKLGDVALPHFQADNPISLHRRRALSAALTKIP